jgi:hypothetical protein
MGEHFTRRMLQARTGARLGTGFKAAATAALVLCKGASTSSQNGCKYCEEGKRWWL